jgi:CxxC-x17-CxxC domain-containing protein
MKNTYHSQSRGGSSSRAGGKKFGSYGDRSAPRERSSFKRPFHGGDDRFDRPQLHDATCAGCGKPCQVPFKPNGSKPIFCRFCFKKEGGGETMTRGTKRSYVSTPRRDDGEMSYDRPRTQTAPSASVDLSKLEAKLASIEKKLDLLIESVTVDEDMEDDEEEEGGK